MPNQRKENEHMIEEDADFKEEIADKSDIAAEQKERDYYYDDSHGYKVFDPDADEEE